MSHSHLMNPGNHPGGCWACQHFHGQTVGQGAHAVCEKDKGRPIVMGQPKLGCVYWKYDGRWKPRRERQFPTGSSSARPYRGR